VTAALGQPFTFFCQQAKRAPDGSWQPGQWPRHDSHATNIQNVAFGHGSDRFPSESSPLAGIDAVLAELEFFRAFAASMSLKIS
jgi:hypothetical protein